MYIGEFLNCLCYNFNMQIISLVFFLVVFICQLWRREWLGSKIRYFLGLSVIVVVSWATLMSRAQYFIWKGSDLSKLFLPPHASITYFLQYAMWKFWAPYLISFSIGLIFFGLAKYYNYRRNDQFFEADELYIIWLSIFLVSHPLWIFYLLSLFSGILLISLVRSLVLKNNSKLPLYYFWLPIAAFVILISKWLITTSLFLGAKV